MNLWLNLCISRLLGRVRMVNARERDEGRICRRQIGWIRLYFFACRWHLEFPTMFIDWSWPSHRQQQPTAPRHYFPHTCLGLSIKVSFLGWIATHLISNLATFAIVGSLAVLNELNAVTVNAVWMTCRPVMSWTGSISAPLIVRKLDDKGPPCTILLLVVTVYTRHRPCFFGSSIIIFALWSRGDFIYCHKKRARTSCGGGLF